MRFEKSTTDCADNGTWGKLDEKEVVKAEAVGVSEEEAKEAVPILSLPTWT